MTSRVFRRGFTLIEVLVVIAVIAITSASLLSAAAPAIERSKQVGCSSNLRQLYLAEIMYSDDQDGHVPCYTNDELALAQQFNAGMAPSNSDQPTRLKASLLAYSGSNSVWYCPDDRFARTRAYYLGIRHAETSYYFRTIDQRWPPGPSLDQLRNATLLISDATDLTEFSDPELFSFPIFSTSNHGRNATNYVAPDGSLHHGKPSQLVPNPF